MPAPDVPDSSVETIWVHELGALNGTLVALEKENRTADTWSGLILNPGAKGMYLIIDADTVAATESFTFEVRMRDPTDGSSNAIYMSAAISTAAEYVYFFYPASIEDPGANGGMFTDEVQIAIPRYFWIYMDHSSTGTHNYSVSISFLP